MLSGSSKGLPRCSKAYICSGWLEECAGAGQTWHAADASVANFLETIQQAVADTRTRIMIVSRDEPEIRQALVRSSSLTLLDYKVSPDDVHADTELYARSIVDKKLHNKDETIKSGISTKLASRCNGQFLWVRMQEPSLRSGKNRKQLEAAIDTSPAGLDHLYDRDWQRLRRLPKGESTRAVSLLRLAAFALRPLTVAEITEALLIREDDDDFPVDEMPDSIDQDYVDGEILGLCGGLVEVRYAVSEQSVVSRTVHLAHFSVKEFFIRTMSDGASFLLVNERLCNSNVAAHSNILAMMCLRYVSFQTVWQRPCGEPSQRVGHFLYYAAGSWHQHANVSKPRDGEVVRFTNIFFNERNEQWRSWAEWFGLNHEKRNEGQSDSEPTVVGPLYYASRLCLTETVTFLLREQRCDINEVQSSGMTALAASCHEGNLRIVAMLLQAGADTKTVNNGGWTPLFSASSRGHIDMVRLLLGNGADVIATDNNRWTPLHLASQNGHIELVRLLLEKGADATAANNDRWTPLHAASANGHIEVVRLLLENGADSMAAESDRGTPLHVASAYGHVEVVRLFLEKGADVMIAHSGGWTPLHAASANGHVEAVRLLLEKGADFIVADNDGWTSLHAAADNGYVEVAKLLIEKGDDITAAKNDGWTSLHLASQNGHIEVVRLLLERGADAGAVDSNRRTAFFFACARGHVEVVEHLAFDVGVANAIDRYGATPLFAAARNGNETVVSHLFAMECDTGGFRDGFGRSLLWWASKSGNAQVVDAVLQFTKSKGIQVCDSDLAVEPRSTAVGELSMWCDCCTRHVLEGSVYYECSVCQGGDFDLCVECFEMGAQCHDEVHTMLLRQPAVP